MRISKHWQNLSWFEFESLGTCISGSKISQFIFFLFVFQVIKYTKDLTDDGAEGSSSDEMLDSVETEDLFRPTRSGRIAGGWRLAQYIGKDLL